MLLVTGGSGFIGSNFVQAVSDETEVVVCDGFGFDNKWKNLRYANVAEYVFPYQLNEWLLDKGDKLTGIIHMGAISATTERDVDLIVSSNLQLSKQLWDFATDVQIPFIYASSAATYGAGENGFEDRSDLSYLQSLRPLNPYGWSKNAFDCQIIAAQERGHKSPPKWAGLKFFNVYGMREDHKGSMRSVASVNYETLRDGNTLKLFKSYIDKYNDGEQMRDFVFVDDCVDVVKWMLANDFKSDLYNIGSGRAETWKAFGEAMFKALNLESNFEFIEMPEHLQGKYQHFTEANIEKLQAQGYSNKPTNIGMGVRKYYSFLNNESE